MKAVLIDAKNRTVTDVEYSGDYREIYTLIGCRCFTLVRGLPDGDDLFVDDEGLLTVNDDSTFFQISWYPTPLVGSGLILSCDEEGDSQSAKHDAAFYKPHVRFMGPQAAWLTAVLQ